MNVVPPAWVILVIVALMVIDLTLGVWVKLHE